MAPSNLNLPLELIYLVTDHLEPSAQDINALVRTSRALNACLNPRLYADEARVRWAIVHAAKTGHAPTIERTLAYISERRGVAGVKKVMSKYHGNLLTFTAHGNHARVAENLLGCEGIDPMLTGRAWDGETPLMTAAKRASIDVMRLLLADDRVNPDHRNIKTQNALFLAVLAPSTAAVELLLKDGRVELNTQDNSGFTPMSLVAEQRDMDMARLLLDDPRVDTEFRDGSGCSPLMHAARTGFVGMAEILIERNANVNAISPSGFTPLVVAVCFSRAGILRLLLAQPNIELNRRGKDRMTPLLHAVRSTSIDAGIIETLLAMEGIDVNAREQKFGDTPLLHALRHGRFEAVNLLLACEHVDVNAKDKRCKTLLILAIFARQTTIARRILKRDDVNVNRRDLKGNTALMWAVQRQYLDAIKLLLAEKDARRAPHDMGKKDAYGHTALSMAALQGWTVGVQAILPKCSASVINARNHKGKTALALAVEKGHTFTVRAILARKGVDVNCRDANGQTPLHAVMENVPGIRIVESLLAKPGLDVNTKDVHEKTALAIARERYGSEARVVRLLVAHSKDRLNRTDRTD